VDVVILDYVLAKGTAVDCLPALRRHRPQARIIVYTAHVGVARDAHVLQLGADYLVPKMSVVVEDVVGIVFAGLSRPEAPAARRA
jgi:DNA-binding NarL/FixJ family response regulator